MLKMCPLLYNVEEIHCREHCRSAAGSKKRLKENPTMCVLYGSSLPVGGSLIIGVKGGIFGLVIVSYDRLNVTGDSLR